MNRVAIGVCVNPNVRSIPRNCMEDDSRLVLLIATLSSVPVYQ